MPAVLKSLKNVLLFQCEMWNDNQRFYPKAIVTKKILTPKVKNEMKIGALLGEIDHPEKRFGSNLDFVSHAITDLRFDEKTNTLYGDIDILDTPRGRILKTLSDYGAVGFSARAMGKSKPTKEGEIVDVDSYMFKTFDAVVTPGFNNARAFNESGDSENNLKMELTNLYESFSEEDKFKVRNIYEKLDLIEKSDYKKKYTKDLYTSSNTTSTSLLDRIKDANLELPLDDSKFNESEGLVNEGTNTMSTDNIAHESEIDSYKLEIELNEEIIDDLNNQLNFSKQINEALKHRTLKMQESIDILNKALLGKEEVYTKNLSSYKDIVETLQNEVLTLENRVSTLQESLNEKSNEIESLNDSLNEQTTQIKVLNEDLKYSKEVNRSNNRNIQVLSAKKQDTILNENKEDELTALLYKNLK